MMSALGFTSVILALAVTVHADPSGGSSGGSSYARSPSRGVANAYGRSPSYGSPSTIYIYHTQQTRPNNGNKRPMLNPCRNLNCRNGGHCIVTSRGQASCQCTQGYSGNRCQNRRGRGNGNGNGRGPNVNQVCSGRTCNLATTCRACLTCDTCQAESQCVNNEVLIKALDLECQAQQYQEAVLVMRNDGSLPYMQLKCRGPLAQRTVCPTGSWCIEDGRGGGTCCRQKVDPGFFENKPGYCPSVSAADRYSCRGVQCQRDSDCAGAMKCCPGCGNVCVSPVPNPPTQPCTSGGCGNPGNPVPTSPCQNVQCYNGGQCQVNGQRPVCVCAAGYTGQTCSDRIAPVDPCQDYTCYNGGRCTAPVDIPHCSCPRGYTGSRCENEIDPCQSYTCYNGGRCVAQGTNPSCQCPQGYTGPQCQNSVDPCQRHTCYNGGRCVPQGSNPLCQCPQRFTGPQCQTIVDPCQGYTCYNGGRCVPQGTSPSCQCTQGYTGPQCQTIVDPCQSYTCYNGGRCVSQGTTPSCQCPQGYNGAQCEARIIRRDPCDGYTCYNGGNCVAPADAPYCNCPAGYTGARCELVIDSRQEPDVNQVCGNSSCSLTTTCRACLPCATCQAQGQCVNNQFLTRDLDIECQVQMYQEAVLVISNNGIQPYEQLRCGGSLAQRTGCPAGSACVRANGGAICCRNRVNPSFFQNKPGSCPAVTGSCGGISCRGDSDCSGGQKCCSACGNQCVSPSSGTSPCGPGGCGGQTCPSGNCAISRSCPVVGRNYPGNSFFCLAQSRQCNSDHDCSFNQKCCSTRCGIKACTTL